MSRLSPRLYYKGETYLARNTEKRCFEELKNYNLIVAFTAFNSRDAFDVSLILWFEASTLLRRKSYRKWTLCIESG